MDETNDMASAAVEREPDIVNVRRVSIAAIALVATLAACVGISVWLQHGFSSRYARPVATEPSRLPATAGPPMQPDPATDLARFRAQKEAMLHQYRWVDRGQGIAQIPVDEAMRIIAQRSSGGGAAARR